MSQFLRFAATMSLFCSTSAALADPPSGPASKGPSSKELQELIKNVESMWAPRNLPSNCTIKVLKKYPDGTVLILAKPRFWISELGCVMLSDGSANIYTLATFAVEGVSYNTIWSSRLSPAPLELSAGKTYRMQLRLEDRKEYGRWCDILKMWDGKTLLLDRTKKVQKQERK